MHFEISEATSPVTDMIVRILGRARNTITLGKTMNIKVSTLPFLPFHPKGAPTAASDIADSPVSGES